MDSAQVKELKTKIRTLLVTFICALSMEEITHILETEASRDSFFDKIVAAIQSHFQSTDAKSYRHIIDSIVGNMTQCLADLGPKAPVDADPTKLEHWTSRWRVERSKSKQACNIDVQDVHSHKKRAQFFTAATSLDQPVETSLAAGADREHLHRTRYMSQCSMGVYLIPEAIKRGRVLGKGAYGVISLCHIEGVTWLSPEVQYVVKEFKGDAVEKRHSFNCESRVQIFHRGIVRCIAQTTEEPWSLIFPHFNGMDLGDMLECVPPPKGTFTMILVAQKESLRRPPIEQEMVMCKHMLVHAPSFMHALVKAMAHAHQKGIIHCDLHPWNIMTDFTKEGVPRVGVIDWGLALRVGIEQRRTNIVNQDEHNLRPWRAPELYNPQSPCPYTKATDVYAVAFCILHLCQWCTDFAEHYKVDKPKRVQMECNLIHSIVQKHYLKPAKQRKTLKNLDEHLDMLELKSDMCLRSLSEMMPHF